MHAVEDKFDFAAPIKWHNLKSFLLLAQKSGLVFFYIEHGYRYLNILGGTCIKLTSQGTVITLILFLCVI